MKASYGRRVIAVFIDWLIAVVPTVILAITGFVMVFGESSSAIGVLLIILSTFTWLILSIWNKIIREGSKGQSVGKSAMSIWLVDAESGLPIGPGRCFLRELVFTLLSSVSAGLYWLIDYLWPLWDGKGERLTDKIMTSRVISR